MEKSNIKTFGKNLKNNRRPTICTTEQHLQNYAPHQKTVSGKDSYANIVNSSKEKVCIIGDNHLKKINKRKLKHNVGKMVSFKCFSGANTKQLDYYIVLTLVDETQQAVVIHIGSNNITDSKIKQINLDDLVQKIIDIGLKCRSYGVRNVAISSILVRKSIRLNQIILKVNNILKVLYATNGLNFICNDEIGREIVWKDGLHLSNDGTAMLADNFAKYLNINLGIDFNVSKNLIMIL